MIMWIVCTRGVRRSSFDVRTKPKDSESLWEHIYVANPPILLLPFLYDTYQIRFSLVLNF